MSGDPREPRITVILPVYDGARFLAEAIESVQAQTYRDFALVVVDDGSTDESAAIAASYPEVRLIRQANAGVSAARNRALEETRSEYVVFLDADDRLLSRALAIGVEHLDARPELGFVYGFHEPIDADGRVRPRPMPKVEHADFLTLLSGKSLVPPSSAMFRRSVFDAVGNFDTSLVVAEDHDLYLRVAQRFPIHCHNQVVVQYRAHDGNVSGQSAVRTLGGVLRAMEKHRAAVRGDPEGEAAYEAGRRHFIELFGPNLGYDLGRSLRRRDFGNAARALAMLLTLHPEGLARYAREKLARGAAPPAQ